MKKYLMVVYIGIIRMFTYRLSFILWRLRNVFSLIFVYFLWTSVISTKSSIFYYTKETLVTYILLINIVSSIVLSTRTTDVANDILSGDLSNDLLKPMSFFKYLISKEVADKILNFIFSVIEIILLLMIFKPSIFIPSDPASFFLFFAMLTISITISFLISLGFSLLAFWSNEIWAPRFIYMTLISLLAGSFFPLDILPDAVYGILSLTPFPYLIFLPTSILLHGITPNIITQMIIGSGWCGILYLLIKRMWKNGIINYSSYGR